MLCVTLVPVPVDAFCMFLLGAALLVVGMGFFTLGAEMSMMPIGEKAGEKVASSKWLLCRLTFCQSLLTQAA